MPNTSNRQFWTALAADYYPPADSTAQALTNANEIAVSNKQKPPFHALDVLFAHTVDCLSTEPPHVRALVALSVGYDQAWHALRPFPNTASRQPGIPQKDIPSLQSFAWALATLHNTHHRDRVLQIIKVLEHNAPKAILKQWETIKNEAFRTADSERLATPSSS